jgi:tRNA (mo5U34)-methyltransferase
LKKGAPFSEKNLGAIKTWIKQGATWPAKYQLPLEGEVKSIAQPAGNFTLTVLPLLKKGGELVLETLVVDGDETTCLVPRGRYAKMRNVWFIPSVAMLEIWLQRAGFKNIRCVDLNTTSIEEQRSTAWMTFESLADYLDPNDIQKTIEGYQAPKRVVMVATYEL